MVGMQAERFDIALQQLERAERDAADRASLSVQTELNLAYRASRDSEPFSRRPVRIPTWALDWMMRNELDLLVVAVRDLFRAIDGLPKDKRPRLIQQHQLTLLRNLTEHWEEEDGPSTTKLRAQYPEFRPGWITHNMREVWVGGKDGGVLLSDIWTWAGQMQDAIEEQLIALASRFHEGGV